MATINDRKLVQIDQHLKQTDVAEAAYKNQSENNTHSFHFLNKPNTSFVGRTIFLYNQGW